MKKVVAVIFGGRSGEHEVSLVSARAILKALDPKRFRPLHVAVLKNGTWLVGKDAKLYLDGKKKRFTKRSLELSQGRIDGKKVDIVFPIIHGTYGEDGRLQGLLEMAGLPYVGCDVMSSAVCMDKDVAKRLLRDADFPVADGISISKPEWSSEPAIIKKSVDKEAGYPCFVKPARLGSSVGITKVKSPKGLRRAIEEAFRYDDKVLIEKTVPDARELECAVLGNGPYEVAGPGEVHPAGEFYDFDDKYVVGASTTDMHAALPAKTALAIASAAAAASRILGVTGLARVDFLMQKGSADWIINEVNTLPGFTSISMYPKLWQEEGLPFRTLITKLLNLAEEKYEKEEAKITDFTSGSDWYR